MNWSKKAVDCAVFTVPLRTPVLVSSKSPAGRYPTSNPQLYGAVPPVAVKVAEYGVFTDASGRIDVVIVGGEMIIVQNGGGDVINIEFGSVWVAGTAFG